MPSSLVVRPLPSPCLRRFANAATTTAALLPSLALLACSPSPAPDVVAADGVLCDLTQRLAANDLKVVCLLQPGEDPHQFHLTPQQSQDLKAARLVLINGYGLTPALKKQARTVAVAELAVPHTPRLDNPAGDTSKGKGAKPQRDPSKADTASQHDSHDGDISNAKRHSQAGDDGPSHADDAHNHGDLDPHVWHDPAQASAMVTLVAQQLEVLKPAARQSIAGRAAQMVAALKRLDRWNRQQLATMASPTSPLATSHRAFASLARAYGLSELPVVDSLSSSESLRPQAFESVLAELKRKQVTMLFAETLPASKSMQRISALSGVPIAPAPLVADGLAKAEDSTTKTSNLVATLTANTCLIVNGLKGHCDQTSRGDLIKQWTTIK